MPPWLATHERYAVTYKNGIVGRSFFGYAGSGRGRESVLFLKKIVIYHFQNLVYDKKLFLFK